MSTFARELMLVKLHAEHQRACAVARSLESAIARVDGCAALEQHLSASAQRCRQSADEWDYVVEQYQKAAALHRRAET